MSATYRPDYRTRVLSILGEYGIRRSIHQIADEFMAVHPDESEWAKGGLGFALDDLLHAKGGASLIP